MLRPEQMSKVSVTGAKSVMPEVIETMHELRLIHLEEYDGDWESFEHGTSMPGTDELADRLVTVRSIESILGLASSEIDRTAELEDVNVESWIESIRQQVNELDDRRTAIRQELHTVEEAIDRVAPFATLGIDLDLLRGYDTVSVSVGRANEQAVRDALEASAAVRAFELFETDGIVAIVAAPAEDAPADPITEALVGVEFSTFEIPDNAGDPNAYLTELQERKPALEADLEAIETKLEELKVDIAPQLLRVEGALTVEVEKKQAPLIFATTERSFVAEGWVPTAKFEALETALTESVDEHIVVEEFERAAYTEHHEEGAVATDGGKAQSMHGDDPPVIQNNPKTARPFELLVNLVSRPRYSELDPTLIVFLTFPLAFGFMIGDIGYGILYMAMGAVLYRFDSEVMRGLGIIAIWAGIFTTIFGYLYDDIFGVHMADMASLEAIYPYLIGAGTLDKGLQAEEWALLWLIVAILFGILHLNIGFIMGFINDRGHGLRAAVMENVSWMLALNGFFLWVFSTSEVGSLGLGVDLTAPGPKPDFLVGNDAILAEFVGFAGFPEVVGVIGLLGVGVGIVMVGLAEGIEGLVESPAYILAHSLSYLRMTAVLLAKGGMAFVVNILVFGGYSPDGEYVVFGLPGTDISGMETQFVGLIHMDPLLLTLPIAVLVFILGHILVLLLGITAAGIQMIRLEWVEFFQKFYHGGGDPYEPYGASRETPRETT